MVEDIRREQAEELGRLRGEVERLTALEAAAQKYSSARRLLRELDLPDPDSTEPWAKAVVSRQFIESLMAAPDEGAMRALVEERSRLVRHSPATLRRVSPGRGAAESRDQHLVYAAGALDGKSFVEAIT